MNPGRTPDEQVVAFAWRMRRIPRLAVRCVVYGTVSVAVDERHARNILRKVVPQASSEAVYDALCAMQERLDASVLP